MWIVMCERIQMNSITIALDKAFFFHPKSIDIFLFSQRKHMLWYSLEGPWRWALNEYPQHMFSLRKKKKYLSDLFFLELCKTLFFCEKKKIMFSADFAQRMLKLNV